MKIDCICVCSVPVLGQPIALPKALLQRAGGSAVHLAVIHVIDI